MNCRLVRTMLVLGLLWVAATSCPCQSLASGAGRGWIDRLWDVEVRARRTIPRVLPRPIPVHPRPASSDGPSPLDVERIERIRLLNHANVPLKVVMVCAEHTRDEVQGVFEAVKQINESEGVCDRERLRLHIIPASPRSLEGLSISPEDLRKYVEIDRYYTTRDIWMQDWGEIAAIKVAGEPKEHVVVFDSKRGRGLEVLPGVLAREWSSHYVKYDRLEDGPCGNYGGNIEVTPDDMLVIGDTSTPRLRALLARCGYADRMAVLDTKWLLVGHVDEFSSTIAVPGCELGYAIVKADPCLALDLLRRTDGPGWEASVRGFVSSYLSRLPQFPDIYADDGARGRGLLAKVDSLHGYLTRAPSCGGPPSTEARRLVATNEQIACRIDANVERLKTAIRQRRGNVEIPVISFPSLFDGAGSGEYEAMLPGVVNMVVLRNHLLVPDPYVPEFRESIRKSVAPFGYTCHFIPNASYHFLSGQLHCGTNVFRHPNRYVHPRYREAARSQRFGALHPDAIK